MRIHRPLDTVLSSRARVAVLRELVSEPSGLLTGREIARRARIAHAQGAAALSDLESAGLVRRRSVGRSAVWSVETENVLMPVLRSLFEAEQRLSADLEEDLRRAISNPDVLRADWFGSTARGLESEGSDIDLFVVATSNGAATRVRDQLYDLSLVLRRKYGLWLSPLVYTRDRLRRPPNPALLAEIERVRRPLVPGRV